MLMKYIFWYPIALDNYFNFTKHKRNEKTPKF